MAGSARRIVVEFIGDGGNLSRELDGLQRKSGKFGSFMKSAGKAAAYGLGAGLAVAGGAAVKFAQAAADDEQAAELMAKQFRNNAKASDEQIAATERWITAQGRALGVTDDELRPALSRLITSTKDVGKAQDLARLAMDVSAGSGKSLESVSTALMKANNGQVSALSRLGINTKNAAGETISMEQATKRMADQFGGAASAKAQTMQGKMDRLKLILSETGEEIGYKLLPIATKLADWFLREGVPAIQRMSRKFEEWWPTIQKVGRVTGDVLVVLGKFAGFLLRSMPDAIRNMVRPFQPAIEMILRFAETFPEAKRQAEAFVNGVREKFNQAKTFISNFPAIAKQALGHLGGVLLSAGRDLIQGLIDGIQSKISSLTSKLREVTNLIPKFKGPESKDKILLKPAGVAIMEGLIAGIDKGKVKLTKVLDKITAFIEKRSDRLKDLIEKRASVVEAFRGFTSSIFGTDLSSDEGQPPATIDRLLKAGQDRRFQAERLQADVASLLSKGLSRDLLEQLQGAGESGLEQIHLLAQGTQAQIDQANADNAATVQALQAAGLAVGNTMYAAEIKAAQRDVKNAEILTKALDKWAEKQDKNTVIRVTLDGKDLVASISRYNRQQGNR